MLANIGSEQLKKRIGDLERTIRNVRITTDELKQKKYGTEYVSGKFGRILYVMFRII